MPLLPVPTSGTRTKSGQPWPTTVFARELRWHSCTRGHGTFTARGAPWTVHNAAVQPRLTRRLDNRRAYSTRLRQCTIRRGRSAFSRCYLPPRTYNVCHARGSPHFPKQRCVGAEPHARYITSNSCLCIPSSVEMASSRGSKQWVTNE